MGINVFWEDENQQILRFDFEVRWSWEDFQAAVQTSGAMMLAAGHRVDMMAVMPDGATFPLGNAINQFKLAFKAFPPNMGLMVAVGGHIFARALVAAVRNVSHLQGRIELAPTEAEARRIIQQSRSKMPADSVELNR